MSLRYVEIAVACPLFLAAFPCWASLDQIGVLVKYFLMFWNRREKPMGIMFPSF